MVVVQRRLVDSLVLLPVLIESQAAHLTQRHHLLVGQLGLLLLPLPPLLLVRRSPDLVLGPRWSEEVVAAPEMHVTWGAVLCQRLLRVRYEEIQVLFAMIIKICMFSSFSALKQDMRVSKI